jgi:hypothetical protein
MDRVERFDRQRIGRDHSRTLSWLFIRVDHPFEPATRQTI